MTPARVEVLENGLTVLLREDHAQPLIALCTHVDGGSRTETDDLKGLSHYYEHTIFRGGTSRQAELETRKAFRELGEFGGYTTDDHTTYYLVVPKERLDEAFWRYADALLGLEVTAEKIERDRQSVVQEYAMRVADSPDGRAWAKLFDTAFTTHPYRVTPIGRLEVIAKAQLDAFRTFYAERYVPNQMFVAAVGDFDSADMLRRIRETFGKKPAGRASFELGAREPEQREFREAAETAPSELVYGLLGFKAPELAHPDAAAVRLLDAVLLGGKSSRLNRALKEEKALAVDLGSDAEARKDPALWTFEFSVKPADEGELVRTLLRELGRVARAGVSQDELVRARTVVERDFLFGNETVAAQAIRLCDYAVKRALPLEARVLDDLERVTAADLRRVAEKTLHWGGATLVLVRPESAAKLSYAADAKEMLVAPPAASSVASQTAGTHVATAAGGMRLVLRTDRRAGVVAVVAAVRGGQWLEGPGSRGGMALLARLLTRGTAALDERALGETLDALGARVAAEPGEDLTTVTMTVPGTSLARALPVFLDVLFHPRLDPDAFEKSRKEALAELASIPDDSFRETNVAFRRALYGELPYAWPVAGDEASLKALRPDDLRALHARAFAPANVVVAAVGDLDADEVRAAVEKALSGLPKTPAPKLDVPRATVTATVRAKREIAKAKAQVTFDFGRLAPGLLDPSMLALRVASRALGSRLFFRWVYEEGMAYRMWTRYTPLVGPAPFYFEMGVAPENREKALRGVEREVADAAREGLTKGEIETAKRSLVQSQLLDLERAEHRAAAYATDEALGLGASFVDEFAARVAAVKEADVDAALRDAVDPSKSVLVVLGPAAPAVGEAPRSTADTP